MRLDTVIQMKKIRIHDNGDVYVNGTYTNLRQWSSNAKRWSNGSGQEIHDLRNKSLEEVLKFKGYIRGNETVSTAKVGTVPIDRFGGSHEPHISIIRPFS